MIPSFTSEKAKTASRLRDGDVGAGDEPGATAERVALDAGDDGSRAPVDRLEHGAERVRVGHVGVEVELDRGPHPLDICAGAEARPVAGEQHRPRLADVDERLGELRDQVGVEGVAGLRARQRDAEHVVVALDPKRPHWGMILRANSITLRAP